MKTDGVNFTLQSQSLSWKLQSLTELDASSLFELLKLRVDVFVVEQQCIYPELDATDRCADTLHVTGFSVPGEAAACARLILPEGIIESGLLDRSSGNELANTKSVRIGRVAVAENYRGKGIAREMMQVMMGFVSDKLPGSAIELSAQTYLTGFYSDLGFKVCSTEYLEDGIPHIDMRYARAD